MNRILTKKLNKYFKQILKRPWILYGLTFGLIGGIVLLFGSNALTVSSYIEPENGALSGSVTYVRDSTASRGVAIRFQDTTVKSKTQLQYFVSPHPDDVYSAWGMVQHSVDNYPVFITLTNGEHTALCTDQTLTVVNYGTFINMFKDSANCKAARLTSLNAWFDDQATRDSTLDNLKTAPTKQYCFTPDSATIPFNTNNNTQYNCATYRVGPKSARVEFDLGDGNLTTDEVNWAIKNVRNSRNIFPVTNEYGLVADAYYNKSYANCGIYTHPDHYAVQSAIFHTDQFTNDPSTYHPQFGVTCASDPDYQATHYSKIIDSSDYSANMFCASGFFQNRYAWLVFGGNADNCWSSGYQSQMVGKIDGVVPADEYFWIRSHPQS